MIGVSSRLIPHWPNFTPLVTLSLLAGAFFSRRRALVLVMTMLVLSDVSLSWLHHYPLFGSWTLFTYTGFLSMIFLGRFLRIKPTLIKSILYALSCSVGYWLWTNFGVWWLSNLYPYTQAGFINCYFMALPFLRNDLIGAVSWMFVLYYFLLCPIHSFFSNDKTERNIPFFGS